MTKVRQGDVLFVPADPGSELHAQLVEQGLEAKLRPVRYRRFTPKPDRVIAIGEATGHAHVLEAGAIVWLTGGWHVAVIDKLTRVLHEDHNSVILTPGVWDITRQREYNGTDTDRQVWD